MLHEDFWEPALRRIVVAMHCADLIKRPCVRYGFPLKCQQRRGSVKRLPKDNRYGAAVAQEPVADRQPGLTARDRFSALAKVWCG